MSEMRVSGVSRSDTVTPRALVAVCTSVGREKPRAARRDTSNVGSPSAAKDDAAAAGEALPNTSVTAAAERPGGRLGAGGRRTTGAVCGGWRRTGGARLGPGAEAA